MPATRRLILIIIVLLFLLLFLAVPGVSWAQTPQNPWQDPARELAKKIVAITGPRLTVALAVRNLSSLSDSEVAAVRLALDAELRAAGLRLAANANSAPELRITLSENVQGLLWIAEIPHGDSRDVAIISLPKAAAPPPTATTQMFVLQSKLIYQQDEPILDFGLTDVPTGATASMLVLEARRIVLFRLQGESWVQQQDASFPGTISSLRDLRGRLLFDRTIFTAYAPGVSCTGFAPKSLNLECEEEDYWNFLSSEEFAASGHRVERRNFFTNFVLSGTNSEGFPDAFTILGLKQNNHLHWVVAGIDGLARLYSEDSKLLNTFTGWGSELASIETDCGSRWQILASQAGDWTEPDALQAFEIVENQPVPVSAPVSFSGPITALWTSAEGATAHAVVRNLKIGRYEAYTLTLSCGR